MKRIVKNKTIALLAGATALCLSGAIVSFATNSPKAFAAEGDPAYYVFVNVGANTEAELTDEALGLTKTDNVTVTEAGKVTTGSTLFTSYAENAKYFVQPGLGDHQVAIAVKAGATVKIGGEAVDLPADAGENIVVSTEVAGDFTLEVEGKLCGVLVADAGAKVLMTADYTPGQVIPYGALLADVLDDATGYYSDGSTAELPINYGDIAASNGVNVNFTTVDVKGTIKIGDTTLDISRYLITMPEDLVYFINVGSYDYDDVDPDTADDFYAYNQTIFDYYGEALINNGTPDQTTSSQTSWGLYDGNFHHSDPGDAAFPYNSIIWTNKSDNLGYRLTDLEAGASYRIWIGTLSHWHGRTVGITFNNQVYGSDTMSIPSRKGFSIFENVPANDDGKIDIFLKGDNGSENQPTICFIAVQKAESVIAAAPSDLNGNTTIGLEEHSLVVSGVTEGAKVQVYNAARPNQILFEEMVDMEKVEDDGSYLLDWGAPFEGISQFNVVQVTNGGVSGVLNIAVTDIEGFAVTLSPEGYTPGTVTVTVTAHANSGIASWAYRVGEYGTLNTFELDRPYAIHESFIATKNDDYVIIVTSGLGVTYSETITVNNIDINRPVINITPSSEGWTKNSYNVAIDVESVAPVVEYRLFKNGVELTAAETAPTSIKFTETGEYLITVKTAAGQSATSTICVSDTATTTNVEKNLVRRTITYKFADNDNYTIAAVSAYQLLENRASRMTIASGNSMDVYNAGTYVVMVTTTNGTVEMFALNVTASDFSATPEPTEGGNSGSNGGSGSGLGVGIGVGVGGIVIAAAAITVTFILTKKKKS